MSEAMVTVLISAGATVAVSTVTLIVNAYIERFKSKIEIQQNMIKSKRENLSDVYMKLINIINLYPSSSPNDILNYVENPPNYSMEYFDAVLSNISCQVDDYKNQLNNESIGHELKYHIETQISNREYAKKQIIENRDKYFVAKDKYKSFCESDKVTFELYAGQEVRNRLVQFEIVINNVFISGRFAGEDGDPVNNIIHVSRRNLIDSMRFDLGI
ncbi:hypothetical protein [Vallitalea guaymasensis]|uniref:Uncharacterized protein n=1 Tax=Vallitalea guaymasensis TaxID=1185412 RepID=A0A8J8MB52_9FIRM|nr:hypothetical protein [Vallitalea guaymasensis]QUH29731.1 hypothetical protein HYG85_12780 [Vallitalea guaymasensis]